MTIRAEWARWNDGTVFRYPVDADIQKAADTGTQYKNKPSRQKHIIGHDISFSVNYQYPLSSFIFFLQGYCKTWNVFYCTVTIHKGYG